MRTLTWDYDTNTVTEWCRMGSCNHCGECCEVMIYLRVIGECFNGDARDGGDNTTGEGIWHQVDKLFWGGIEITEESMGWNCYEGVDEDGTCIDGQGERCLATTIDDDQKGRCNHDSERKRGLCTAWPLHPDHVECFDNCSYRFVKLNEWEIEDRA